jgi:hypothetical protein
MTEVARAGTRRMLADRRGRLPCGQVDGFLKLPDGRDGVVRHGMGAPDNPDRDRCRPRSAGGLPKPFMLGSGFDLALDGLLTTGDIGREQAESVGEFKLRGICGCPKKELRLSPWVAGHG